MGWNYRGGDKAEAYEEYALYGGMSLVLFRKTEDDKFKYLSSLFEEVYFKQSIEDLMKQAEQDCGIRFQLHSLKYGERLEKQQTGILKDLSIDRLGGQCVFGAYFRRPAYAGRKNYPRKYFMSTSLQMRFCEL